MYNTYDDYNMTDLSLTSIEEFIDRFAGLKLFCMKHSEFILQNRGVQKNRTYASYILLRTHLSRIHAPVVQVITVGFQCEDAAIYC